MSGSAMSNVCSTVVSPLAVNCLSFLHLVSYSQSHQILLQSKLQLQGARAHQNGEGTAHR